MNIWSWVLAVHILCAVLWVGGMAFALMVMRPALGTLEPAQRVALHVPILRRFLLIVWHAMPLILISGFAMVPGLYGGFANLPWAVNLMMLGGIVMAIIFLILFFGPWREMRAAPAPGPLDRIRRLITVNLWLGFVVVILGALGHLG
jgi:uncharacterized membrane protein